MSPIGFGCNPTSLNMFTESSFPGQTPLLLLLSWTDPIVPKLNYSSKESGGLDLTRIIFWAGGVFRGALSNLSHCSHLNFKISLVSYSLVLSML